MRVAQKRRCLNVGHCHHLVGFKILSVCECNGAKVALVFLYGLVGPLAQVNILFWSTVSKDERKRNYYRQVLSWIQGKSTKKIGRKRSDFRGPLHALIVECCCHQSWLEHNILYTTLVAANVRSTLPNGRIQIGSVLEFGKLPTHPSHDPTFCPGEG